MVGAWLLGTKLITREGQYSKALVFVFFVQSTQPGVLWRESSGTRDVYNETDLIFVVGQVDGVASNRIHGEVVHVAHVVAPF